MTKVTLQLWHNDKYHDVELESDNMEPYDLLRMATDNVRAMSGIESNHFKDTMNALAKNSGLMQVPSDYPYNHHIDSQGDITPPIVNPKQQYPCDSFAPVGGAFPTACIHCGFIKSVHRNTNETKPDVFGEKFDRSHKWVPNDSISDKCGHCQKSAGEHSSIGGHCPKS